MRRFGDAPLNAALYKKIYDVVRRIPPGHVATYGQIAKIVGRCTPRVVGYAMSALPSGTEVPWHRVINREGKISPRRSGDGDTRQRLLLEAEGVCFDRHGRVDFTIIRWLGRIRERVLDDAHRRDGTC